MTRAQALLSQYRSGLRLIAEFDKECIPLAKIISSYSSSPSLDIRDSLRHIRADADPRRIQSLVSRAHQQLHILLHAEDHTRLAFGTWHSFLQKYKRAQLWPQVVCEAIEDAALALPDLANGEPSFLEDLQDPQEEEQRLSEHTAGTIDSLAQQVLHAAPPFLFARDGAESPQASENASTAQATHLEHLHEVLVGELKYVEKPFEWAYEGLAPLLLKDVVETHRGISFSLAVLFSCTARRLGLCLTPVPISRTDTGQGYSIAGTPDLSRWILRHDGATPGQWPEPAHLQHESSAAKGPHSRWYWDPASGRILSRFETLRSFPKMADSIGKEALLQVWTEMLRVAFVAHQRRGDSDAVAHCLHQLLALDLTDRGWDAILRQRS